MFYSNILEETGAANLPSICVSHSEEKSQKLSITTPILGTISILFPSETQL